MYLQETTFRAEKFFKKLAGMKDLEDALQRLDKLTREEALMVAAEGLTVAAEGLTVAAEGLTVATEGLTITREIGDKVEDVDDKICSVNEGRYYLMLGRNFSSPF